MDKAALVGVLLAALPYVLSAILAWLLWRLPKGEKIAVQYIRDVADKLEPWQHDIVERGIIYAEEWADQFSGEERLTMATDWIIGNGVPVNKAYVQAVFSYLKNTEKKQPKEAA